MEETVIDFTIQENQTRLKELLKNENLCITFTKKDGTERQIFCSLNDGYFPKTEKTGTRTVSTSSLPVFDLEKKEWRSFRWDSITNVEKYERANATGVDKLFV